VRKREKAHVGRDSIDNGLRIAFGGIGSYDRTGTAIWQSFSELSNPLNFAADSTAKLIGSNRRGAIRDRVRIYNLYELLHTAVPDTRGADISAKCSFHDFARALGFLSIYVIEVARVSLLHKIATRNVRFFTAIDVRYALFFFFCNINIFESVLESKETVLRFRGPTQIYLQEFLRRTRR